MYYISIAFVPYSYQPAIPLYALFAKLISEPLLVLVLVLLFCAIGAIGLWTGRHATTLRDYAVANHAMGTGMMTLTLIATVVDGQDLIRNPNYFYKLGLSALFSSGLSWVLYPLFIGFFIAPKMVYFKDCYTLPAVMDKLLGLYARIFTASITIIVGFAFIVHQFSLIGDLFSTILNMPAKESIIVIGMLTTCYIWWSGIRAVSSTDVLQFAVMVFGLSYGASTLLARTGDISTVLEVAPPQWSWQAYHITSGDIVRMLFLTLFPSIVVYPGIMQRMLMARDVRQGRYMFFSFAFFNLFFLLLISLIALAVYSSTGVADPRELSGGSVIYCLLAFFGNGPAHTMFIIGLLAAMMSTIDSYSAAIGLTLVYDIVAPLAVYGYGKPLEEHQLVTAIRITTLLVGMVGTAMGLQAWHSEHLESVSFYFSGLIWVGCVLPILGWKATYPAFWISIAVYGLTMLGGINWLAKGSFAYGAIMSHNLDVMASCVSLLAFLLVHLFTHSGIMMVSRSYQQTSEQLWQPRQSKAFKRLQAWWQGWWHLDEVAYAHFHRYGATPYLLGFFLAMQHMVPQLRFQEGNASIPSMILLGIRMVGVLLLTGLWLERVWPAHKRTYFPAYYYFTIAYCLPFMTTLFCLYDAGTTLAAVQWCLMLLLLFAIVDWGMMVHFLPIGVLLALCCFRWLKGIWLPLLAAKECYAVGYLAIGSVAVLTIFGHLKEDHMLDRLRVAKALGRGIADETTNYLAGTRGSGSNVYFFLSRDPVKKIKGKDATTVYQVSERTYRNFEELLEALEVDGKLTDNKVKLFHRALSHERFDIDMAAHSIRERVEEVIHDLFRDNERVVELLDTQLGKDFMAYCSPPFFYHLIYNLVQNAMHHGHAKTIRITTDSMTRTLAVHDDGEGISPAHLPHIFDLFYTSDVYAFHNRTGLGLALVQEIVTSWGAHIRVHSQQGKDSYTCFEVAFPRL